MPLVLDRDRRRIHKIRNLTQSVILIAGIGLLMSVCAYLIWGPVGIFWALIGAPAILLLGPNASPELVMPMYRAAPLDGSQGEGTPGPANTTPIWRARS
jgi:heat shock protein HtpX